MQRAGLCKAWSGAVGCEARRGMQDYRKIAIPADAVARAIVFAIAQPDDVDVSEIIVRPTAISH